jgi:hypothetical protein
MRLTVLYKQNNKTYMHLDHLPLLLPCLGLQQLLLGMWIDEQVIQRLCVQLIDLLLGVIVHAATNLLNNDINSYSYTHIQFSNFIKCITWFTRSFMAEGLAMVARLVSPPATAALAGDSEGPPIEDRRHESRIDLAASAALEEPVGVVKVSSANAT